MSITKNQLAALGLQEATFNAMPQATQTALLEGLKAQENARAAIEREGQIKAFREGGSGVLITEIVRSSTGRTKCEFTIVTNTGIKGSQHRSRMAQSLTGNLYVPGAAPRWLNITGSLLAKAVRHAMDNWKGEQELFLTQAQIMATPAVEEDALGVDSQGLQANQEAAGQLNALLNQASANEVQDEPEIEVVEPANVAAPAAVVQPEQVAAQKDEKPAARQRRRSTPAAD